MRRIYFSTETQMVPRLEEKTTGRMAMNCFASQRNRRSSDKRIRTVLEGNMRTIAVVWEIDAEFDWQTVAQSTSPARSSQASPIPSSDTYPPTPSCLPLMTPSTFVFSSFWLGGSGVESDPQQYVCLQPGDIVAVNHGYAGRREGLVVGSHIDHLVCLALSLHVYSL